ncbi:MAG TPA: NUDIX hydrolase [Verrucomicrobiales bacterium]|nr:NUDIX hydrolase [Verrucomicrobiales bacterium]
MFRWRQGRIEVFLAHPGGPFFQHKDEGYWTLPKGEVEPGESLLETARREFHEEVGLKVECDSFLELGWIRQKGGKIVHGWGFEGDWDVARVVKSKKFKLEWPPESGRIRKFPEIDRAAFFGLDEARIRIKPTQVPLIDRLEALVSPGGPRRAR